MNLPVISFCILSLMAMSSCADNSVNKPQAVNNSDQEQRANNDLSVIALNHLTKNAAGLGINNPQRDLQLIKISKDKYQTQHIKYAQLYKNIPVWGSELIVHIKNNKVYRVDGSVKTIQGDLSVVPKLSSKMAEQSAFEMSGGKYDSQLMVLVEKNTMATLTYLVKLSSGLNRYIVFVDANNGEVVKTLEGMPNTLN